MNCPEETKIEMLLDRMLSPEEAEAVEKHIAVCGRCRAILNRMKWVDDLLRAAAPEPDGEYMRSLPEKLYGKAECGHCATVGIIPTVLSKTFWGLTEAAAVVIVISMISLFTTFTREESPAVTALTESYDVCLFAVIKQERVLPENGFSAAAIEFSESYGGLFTQ